MSERTADNARERGSGPDEGIRIPELHDDADTEAHGLTFREQGVGAEAGEPRNDAGTPSEGGEDHDRPGAEGMVRPR
jgi:hypothetical protein